MIETAYGVSCVGHSSFPPSPVTTSPFIAQPLSSAPDPAAPKGALAIIFCIVFLDLLGFGVIIPLLPFYIPNHQEHSLQVGLLFSIYSICQFVGAPILGALSDRHGRRPVLVISQFGSALGYALLGWVSHQEWRTEPLGLTLIYASRVIDGFSGGNISTAQAYVSDVTTPETRAKGMGLIGAAFGIGFAVGPAMGGILGEWHIAAPAYAAAVLSVAAAVFTYLRLPESHVHNPSDSASWLHPSRLRPVLGRPVAVQLILIAFLSMTSFVMMEACIALFLSREDTFDWGLGQVGWFFALAGVTIAVVQGGLIGRLSKRFGEWPLAIAGPILVAAGMAIFITCGWYPLVPLVLLGAVVNAAGRSCQHPTVTSLLSKHTPRDQQGVTFGLYHAMSAVARVIGPLVGGAVYAAHFTGPFAVAGAIVLAAAGWTLALSLSRAAKVDREEPVVAPQT